MKRLVLVFFSIVIAINCIILLPTNTLHSFSGNDYDALPNTGINQMPDGFEFWADIAIAWSKYRLGDNSWYGMCATFVANAFMNTDATGWDCPKAMTAGASAIEIPEKYNLTLYNTGYEGWAYAPMGALIFFNESKNNPSGHVAIYLGNNEIIHVNSNVRIDNLDALNFGKDYTFMGEYIGWTYPPDPEWRPINQNLQTKAIAENIESTPISVKVYDLLGRTTGIENGDIKKEIPGSFYYPNTREITIAPSANNYRVEISGKEKGTYGMTIMISNELGLLTLTLNNLQTDLGVIHNYNLDADRILKEKEDEVIINININGLETNLPVDRIEYEPYILSSTAPYAFNELLNYWKIITFNSDNFDEMSEEIYAGSVVENASEDGIIISTSLLFVLLVFIIIYKYKKSGSGYQ